MADSSPDTGAGRERGSSDGTPRWVKVFGIITLVVAVLLVILALFGSGHGPGRHAASAGAGGHPVVPGVMFGSFPYGHEPSAADLG